MKRNFWYISSVILVVCALALSWASTLLVTEESGGLSNAMFTHPTSTVAQHTPKGVVRMPKAVGVRTPVTPAPIRAAAILVLPPPSPPSSPPPPSPPPVYASAASNTYPPGQCTWWADAHYHTLAGYYVPWAGDAYAWLMGAQVSGWHTSATPPSDRASIIVLQPGVQGANTTYGHVGVVEQVNSDGNVTTSDLNWGSAPTQVTSVIFQPGVGVAFVWAV